MVTEISITFDALEVDESLGSAEANGSSGVIGAAEHGGECTSPGSGGTQSAKAANANTNVKAMTPTSLFKVFMVFSFGWIVVASFSKRPRPNALQNGRLVLIGIQLTARPSRSKRLYHPNRKVTLI